MQIYSEPYANKKEVIPKNSVGEIEISRLRVWRGKGLVIGFVLFLSSYFKARGILFKRFMDETCTVSSINNNP